jgi:hypothetical protein
MSFEKTIAHPRHSLTSRLTLPRVMDSKFVDCCQADSALKRLHTPIRCRWKRRRSVKSLKYKAEISTAQMFPNTHLLHLHMGIDARREPRQHILLWKRARRQLRTEMTEYGSEAGGMDTHRLRLFDWHGRLRGTSHAGQSRSGFRAEVENERALGQSISGPAARRIGPCWIRPRRPSMHYPP